MKVLFCNLPFLEMKNGMLHTGPNAGSCWPHAVPGLYSYVPFPFFMANACSYLQMNGISATMFDAWAYRLTDYNQITQMICDCNPKILVFETSTPLINQILSVAQRIKIEIGCKIVLTGSHVAAYGDELLKLSYVDHVVQGEYDLACLKIACGDTRRKIVHDIVDDIDNVNGKNWLPYRDPSCLANYLDPSMVRTPIQLQINDVRGCQYSCSYCSWPATMYPKHRQRSAENVLDEIAQVRAKHSIGSIFFDAETWNSGPKERLAKLCEGLRATSLPWSFMGRIDTSTKEQFESFVDAGCVGMRFGAESMYQHLLDRVNKRLSAAKSWENLTWLIGRKWSNPVQFRLLTMIDLPGETVAEQDEDMAKWKQLQALGVGVGNRVDIQVAKMIPLPGTPLWNQLQKAGEGEKMNNFAEFQPIPSQESPLAGRLNTYASAIPLTVKGKLWIIP